ncbi:hypothetical protein ACLM5J_15960 [Nocardioides sp. Bht2]|uniref:hypothetical protein n=1 Tax=Nocardioides sp. Bht2 TaxID=3392297 RepID=UPI0039B4E04D
MGERNNDEKTRDVEEVLRRGLHANAERVDLTAAPRLAGIRPGAGRRRWRTPLLAAAAVALLVGGGLALGQRADEGRSPAADRAADPVATPGGSDPGWRTEYWRSVAVEVPDSWGFGGAPFELSPGSLAACAPSAMVRADGERDWEQRDAGGYVGRPIMLTDACQGYQDGAEFTPPAPYLWFDAGVGEGTVRFDGGFVQQTVVVDGVKLTVGSTDAGLRERVLESARAETPCAPTVDQDREPWPAPSAAGREIATMRVCAYRVDRSRPETVAEPQLSTAIEVGDSATRRYLDALRGREQARDQCPRLDVAESEWVVLELLDDTGAVLRRDVVHLAGDCAGVDVGARGLANLVTSKLTPAMVRPWAVASIPATVYGPSGGKGALLESFIGPQG